MATKGEELAALAAADGILGKADDEEPIFILRAADKTAPDTVRFWARWARQAGAPIAKVHSAFAVADAMERWQHANPTLVKLPD